MADLNTEQLQAALDRLAENFTGLGSTVDAHSKAISDSDDTQKKADRELSKFGLNIEERNKQIQKELDIQEELDKKIKESIPGYDGMTKAQQENIKATRQQETATQDTLKKLKEQNDSIQGLTQEQNAAIAAQLKVNKQKQIEADSSKHQGAAITSAFGQISSSSGILSIAQNAATERFGATKEGALGVNLAFTALNTAIGFGVLAFDQWKAGLDNAFQAQLAYNQQLVLGADGYKLANSQLLARMKLEATQTRQQSDMFQKVGFGLTATAVGLLALRSSSVMATFGLAALGGPISLAITGLTALAALFGLYAAKQKFIQAQEEETAAQTLELQNELRDNLFKVFNDIGNAGMTGAGGMTALKDEAHKAGFALKNIDKFAGILKTSQSDMSLFAAGAVEGVDKFATVTGKMSDEFGMHFRKLGIDQEAQAAATEKYMALQAKLGLSQGKTVDQLAAGAGKYLDELDKTATLLGQTRKEQEDSRAAILAIEQLQAAMMEARTNNDKGREEELSRAISAASSLQKMDPKAAAGLAKLVSSRGAALDEDTIIALQSIPQTLEAVRKGTGTEFSRQAKAIEELNKSYQRSAGQFAATGADTGMVGGTYGKVGEAGIRLKEQQEAARKEAIKQNIKEGTPEFEALLEAITKRKEAKDTGTEEAVKQAKEQQMAAIKRDAELIGGIGIFNVGANKFDGAVDKFVKGTDKPTDKPAALVQKEATAVQARTESKNAAEHQVLIEDQKKAAKVELEAMYKRGASREELVKQETKLAEIEKARVAAEQKEMEAGRKAQQAELEAKNERQRIRKIQNQMVPLTKETSEAQKKVDSLKLEKANIEKEGKERPGTTRDQTDRKLMLEGVNIDLSKAQKELDIKQKQLDEMKKQVVPVSPAGAKPSTPGTASALSGGSTISTSNEQLKESGLRIKSGDVQAPGSKIDPKLLEIAKQVQESIPGFNYFSGFNDQFHQENSPSSQHTKGLAFDFTVNPGRGKIKPSKEDSEKIMGMLQGMGLDKVVNEYDSPSAKATGGHFHAELAMPGAYDGGVFDGPKSGFPVELHGREAIVPMPDPSAKIKIETDSPEKEPLSSVVNSNTNSVVESNNNTALNDMMADLYEMMSSKMDDMISKLDQGNTYSDKLVKAMA